MHDIAEFLKAHDPFCDVDEETLEQLAERVEVEFFAGGTVIFKQGEQPQTKVRVVRKGAVDLVDRGRVLDLLGEGEMFGHPSMLSGLPTGFEARAHEDLLCYELAARDVVPLLARPSGLPYLARSLLSRPRPGATGEPHTASAEMPRQPARALIRRKPVICTPEVSLREAAQRMIDVGASSVLVRGDDAMLGILTDSDLRTRVVAGSVPVDSPVSEVMTSPIITVGAEQTGADVILAMLDNDIRHVPVLSSRSEVLGVIVGIDLVAAEARAPFVLRRAITEAKTKEELREAAGRLPSTVVALDRADLVPGQISQVISVVADSLVHRMIELAVESKGPPPATFAWLALGSHGRREPVPTSDIDSGMAWSDIPGAEATEYMHAIAADVADGLGIVGWRADPHGVTAADEFAASSIGDWRSSIERWLSHPEDNKVLIATSIMLDARTVYGPEALSPRPFFYESQHRPALLRWMLRLALSAKPPTGFMRDIVLEHSGERRGILDIKHGGLLPIVNLARYSALKAGARVTPTVERLRAAGGAGALDDGQVRTLVEAYHLFADLRLEHQVHQLEQGVAPDDRIDPKQLNALTRRYLRDAFREVAAVQKQLAGGLMWDT
jgi:CBS domain-containing protein